MSEQKDFLVELGTEELPPKALLKLANAFAQGIADGLLDANLDTQDHTVCLLYTSPSPRDS